MPALPEPAPSRRLPALGAAAVVAMGLSVMTWASLQPRPGAAASSDLFAPPDTVAIQTLIAPEPDPQPAPVRAAVAERLKPSPHRPARLRVAAVQPQLAQAAPTPAPAVPAPILTPPPAAAPVKSAPSEQTPVAPRPPAPVGDAPIPSHVPG